MNLIKKLEYLFIGLSVAWAIPVVLYKQDPAYSVVLTTVSLILNLVTRQREIIKANSQIARLEKSISSSGQEISAAQTSLLSITSTSSELHTLGDSIEKLDSDVSLLKGNVFNIATEYQSKFTEISTRNNKLHTLIANVKSQLENTTDDLPEVYRQIHALNQIVDRKIVETVDQTIADKKIDQLIQTAVSKKVNAAQQILLQNLSKETIKGRSEGRAVFLEALSRSESRLILVCPWITEHAIDKVVKELIQSALDRGVAINIGWGNLNDVGNNLDNLSTDNLLRTAKAHGDDEWNKIKYGAVEWFLELQKRHHKLVIKPLGTHSKYLVCDRKFALVGSHNFMSSSDRTSWGVSQEEETGLKTTNPLTIDDLIRDFDKVRTADKKTVQKSSRS
jgi:PLD-like domain